MGRIYTASFTGAAFTSGDVWELNCPADAVVALLSFRVGVQSDVADRSVLKLLRATTSGSGGSTATARPKNVGDPAYGGTIETLNTTPAGTLTELERWAFEALQGVEQIYIPEARPIISPSGRLVLNMEDALTAVTIEASLTFEEIGG